MNKSIIKFLLSTALISTFTINLINENKVNANDISESTNIDNKSSIKNAKSKINVKVKNDKHKISGSFYHLDSLSEDNNYNFYASENKNEIMIIPMAYINHNNKKCIMAYSLNKKDTYLISANNVNISGIAIKNTADYNKLKKIIKNVNKGVIKEDIKYSRDYAKNEEEANKDSKKLQKKINNNLKNNQLYQYLSSHKDLFVQKINVFVPNNESTNGLNSGTNTIYLVGNEDQLNKAVDGINNYHPSNSIAILQNNSGVTIFDNDYDKVNNIDIVNDLYAEGEKVLINKRMNANDAMNDIKNDTQHNTYLMNNE